jgi:hypothetical protein
MLHLTAALIPAAQTLAVPADLRSKTTAELAAELLPPREPLAEPIVAHEFELSLLAGGTPQAIVFFARAEPTMNDFCLRERIRIDLSDPSRRPRPQPLRQIQVRLGNCPTEAGAIFATINPLLDGGDGRDALRWLGESQADLRAGRRTALRIHCSDETGGTGCKGGARQVLAGLDLGRIFLVEEEPTEKKGWRYALAITAPGQIFWRIDARPLGDSGKGTVHLTRMVPPPF